MNTLVHRPQIVLGVALACVLPTVPWGDVPAAPGSVKDRVMATERAFAKTMADRDQRGFTRFRRARSRSPGSRTRLKFWSRETWH
jgi:hypothetical protein